MFIVYVFRSPVVYNLELFGQLEIILLQLLLLKITDRHEQPVFNGYETLEGVSRVELGDLTQNHSQGCTLGFILEVMHTTHVQLQPALVFSFNVLFSFGFLHNWGQVWSIQHFKVVSFEYCL